MKQPAAAPASPSAPDCAHCIYYFITHNPSFPYGCRALDFKSRRKPQLEVLEASGNPCMAFEPRHSQHG